MVAKNIEWYKENGTYTSPYIIGAIIVTVGILTLAGIWNATAAAECANRILARKAKA
ncbi:inner membrane protein [Haemophilus influenzae]|nr:inner membrane protein [Haemophilus influenzae]